MMLFEMKTKMQHKKYLQSGKSSNMRVIVNVLDEKRGVKNKGGRWGIQDKMMDILLSQRKQQSNLFFHQYIKNRQKCGIKQVMGDNTE